MVGANVDLSKIQKRSFNNKKCYRLIPSRFPPISLFDDVADENEFEALYAIQKLTNPRIQAELGNFDLVSKQERVFGLRGNSFIMAAFTHINPVGSRFSDGTFGIYYAANSFETAIAETVYHRELFLTATNEPAQEIDMRCLIAMFHGDFLNLCKKQLINTSLYSKDDYHDSQKFGVAAKTERHHGIYYYSVREKNGYNFAILTPKIFKECIQEAHYGYIWDSKRIIAIYKKELIKEILK